MQVRLVEHKRAHNICIVLAGMHAPFPAIAQRLIAMDSSSMSLEQLGALAKAVPSDHERDALSAYLRGEHPDHPGVCDEELLGTVERFFVELLKVRLE
jgi:hypothetical protein